MSHKVSVVIEKDDNGYYAYCPELEGCHSQGATFEEAMGNIKEALDLYIETVPRNELDELLSKEIITTALEVNVA
jgi:predicted RNase H-like HicB family nuclease